MNITSEQFCKIKAVYRLTNEEMGALLGITGPQVSRIINGRRRLTADVAQRLAVELQLTPAKLARILEVYDEFNLRPIHSTGKSPYRAAF